ncbi:MFS transporter [Paenibacillus sp. BSR1-1]|uniref:MFS transporter n=1 Tax=Paenibacillus sp. BSR1-1 TaxID=3020845 RepID=UPI0025B16889|nr:MFS transporter [Paenibacillus sp. BSR1-1]MDN3020248.1 MFS transporter [Paenibacillus sp. BSR1-1]
MNLFFKKDPYKVYIYTCFLSQLFFTFIFTMNLLYQVEIVKLDPLQLVLVGTVLEASVFLFEIPTGIVSDLKSRKLSIIIGYFLIGTGFILEGMFPYFIMVIASQIVWGIGYTFTSGAQQAWIADEIGEGRAADAFIKGANAGNLGKIIAIPLSMFAGYFMINLPIVLGGFGMMGLSVLLFFFMKEEHFKPADRSERVSTWKNIKDNMNQIIVFSKRSSLMRILFLIALFFGFYSEGFDRLWISHILEESGLEDLTEGKLVFFIGGIQFIVVIFSFAALHFISKSSIYQKLTSIYAALFAGSILIVSSLVGFALSSYLIVLLIFYIIIQVARYVMHPLEDIWLNQMIPDSSTRATFFSVKGQVDAIGQISGGPVIGLIAVNFTMKTAILACAFLLTPVLVLYRKILEK